MTELRRMIDQISRDKGIDREILISTLEDAIRSAARKKLGPEHEFEVAFNEDLGEIEVFEFIEVVEVVEDPGTQLAFDEARRMDPDCEIGDELGVKVDTTDFGRIAAQSAKQVIIQRMKDAERDMVYEDYKDRKGEIISGMVLRFDKGNLVVNLGKTEGVVPSKEQTPREIYRPGDRIRAFVLDVKQISRGPQIILSRTHPQFIIELFRQEVPEVAEGVVQIKAVAREPGQRTKIAVYSTDMDIDPVGACVGMKGSRVQAVVQELRGEKIDIVPWDPDVAKFICNALSPAEVSRVIVDEARHTMEVVVPEEMLSLAIGKRGQNVRLSSKLTGWRVDIIHEKRWHRISREDESTLMEVEGIGEATAQMLAESGYTTARELARSTSDELVEIPGISIRKADTLISAAQEVVSVLDQSYRLEEETESSDMLTRAEHNLGVRKDEGTAQRQARELADGQLEPAAEVEPAEEAAGEPDAGLSDDEQPADEVTDEVTDDAGADAPEEEPEAKPVAEESEKEPVE